MSSRRGFSQHHHGAAHSNAGDVVAHFLRTGSMAHRFAFLVVFAALLIASPAFAADSVTFRSRSARSGNWSDPATWEKAHMPQAGDSVQIRPGHAVTYDV